MIIVKWQTRKSPWMIRRIMCRINTLLTLKLWRKSGKRPPKVVVTFCFGLHCRNHYRNPSFLEVLVTFETFCWRCQNLSYFSFCSTETKSILTLFSKRTLFKQFFWFSLFVKYWKIFFSSKIKIFYTLSCFPPWNYFFDLVIKSLNICSSTIFSPFT